jgi:hypothetical protein
VAVTPNTTVSTRQRNNDSHYLPVIKQLQNRLRLQALKERRVPPRRFNADADTDFLRGEGIPSILDILTDSTIEGKWLLMMCEDVVDLKF